MMVFVRSRSKCCARNQKSLYSPAIRMENPGNLDHSIFADGVPAGSWPSMDVTMFQIAMIDVIITPSGQCQASIDALSFAY